MWYLQGKETLRSSGSALAASVFLAAVLTGCGGGGSDGRGGGAGSPRGLVDACGDGVQFATPLVGPAPDWHTPEVRRRALEARERGLGYDFEAQQFVPPAALPSQVLLRPGTQLFPERIFPGWCTAAFVFDGGSRIATAGHCTNEGDLVLALSAPNTVFVIGETTTSVDGGPGDDWALVTIDPEWRPFTSSNVAWVGGPCGTASPGGTPRPLKYVGHGAAIGTGGTPRAGVLFTLGPGCFTASGANAPGDSGAPMLEVVPTPEKATSLCSGGQAVGILTHELAVGGVVPTTVVVGTSVSAIAGALDDGTAGP